jgi:hypothetical protein
VNDLLYRLVEEECRHEIHEWAMKDLEKLGEEEANDLVAAGLVIPSPVTKGRYIVDIDAVARALRSFGSSRSLQGLSAERVHWKFVYLGYFVERARVVACVWAIRPIKAYSDPCPREFHEFWASVPDRPDKILFVWPEWESWEEFLDAFPDLKFKDEGRHEPLGEWIERIRVSPDAPRPARPPDVTLNEIVFGEKNARYEVSYGGQSIELAEAQASLLMYLACQNGYVERDELRKLVDTPSSKSLATLVYNVGELLKARQVKLSIDKSRRGGYKLRGAVDGEPLSARAERALEARPNRIADAARKLNVAYSQNRSRRT